MPNTRLCVIKKRNADSTFHKEESRTYLTLLFLWHLMSNEMTMAMTEILRI